jgi:hypothetical protein
MSIRDFLEFTSKPTISQTFDPLRTLTPTSNIPPTQPAPPSPHSHIFSRMNSGPSITNNPQQFGKENPAQKGVCLIKKLISHLFLFL